MLVRHVAVGLAAQRLEPRLSLGTFVMAALLADVLWTVFVLAGLEQVRFTDGMGAANYYVAVNVAWSHSLVAGAAWAALLAGAFRRRYGSRASAFVAAAVLSHWVLDVISHRPDMPLAPGLSGRYGLGLSTSVPATMAVEGGVWAIALLVYARATQARSRAGTIFFWSVVPLLTLAWYNNVAGPPPPNPDTAPVASLIFFVLLIAWAYAVDALRSGRERVSQQLT